MQIGGGVDRDFAEYLKEKLERNDLSQSELARRTGIGQVKISRIVSCKGRVAIHDIVKLDEQFQYEFIKKLLQKLVGQYILCKLSTIQSLSNHSANDQFKPGNTVRIMQQYRHALYELCPSLSFLQTVPRDSTICSGPTSWYLTGLHKPDGDGQASSFSQNLSKIVQPFQLESRVR